MTLDSNFFPDEREKREERERESLVAQWKAVTGANTVFHLCKETAMVDVDTLIAFPFYLYKQADHLTLWVIQETASCASP
jgi:hypothetical protein